MTSRAKPRRPRPSTIERDIGAILATLEAMDDRLKRADDSRRDLHVSVNALVLRATHIEADVSTLKAKVEGVEQVTEDVKKMRERAFGAGTLGVWLWRVGGAVLSFAAGLAAAYTWLTGRPPP